MIEKLSTDAVKNYEHIAIVNKLNEIIKAVNDLEETLSYLVSDSQSHSSESMDINTSIHVNKDAREQFDSSE